MTLSTTLIDARQFVRNVQNELIANTLAKTNTAVAKQRKNLKNKISQAPKKAAINSLMKENFVDSLREIVGKKRNFNHDEINQLVERLNQQTKFSDWELDQLKSLKDEYVVIYVKTSFITPGLVFKRIDNDYCLSAFRYDVVS